MADIGELLDIIKDECALTITEGLPVKSIEKLIVDCLEKDQTAVVPLEVLDPTIANPPTTYHPPVPPDSSLRQTVWDCIRQDPEISIGINNEGKELSFEDAEAGVGAENQPRKRGKPFEWRLYASESLQWKQIAGHDIDKIRLFPTLWELLKIIAVGREDGILQPTLTTASGQDARSVGPRTKDLAGKGYIMKIPVIANKMRTSKLILKRFYKGALQKRKTQKKVRLAKLKEHAEAGKKVPEDVIEEPLDIEYVIGDIFRLLKAAKNKVMLVEDLKQRVNCFSTRSRRKAIRRILGKLENMGCIKKIRAVGSENIHAEKFEMGPVDEEEFTALKGAKFSKCIRYIRDLRPLEWHEAVKGVRPKVAEDDDFDELDSDDEQDDGYRVIRSGPSVRMLDGRKVVVPLWTRTHLMHIIYDQVLAAGVEGIRSGLLSGAVFGPFYYRPFDQIMGRWTTNSLLNQPDHLKSTSIVRETDLYKRTANYRYWTTENFQTMIEEKQIDYNARDAAANPFKIGQKQKKPNKRSKVERITEAGVLDENGFSKTAAEVFVEADGYGNFQECQNAAPKKGSGLKPPGASPLKGRKRIKREPTDVDGPDQSPKAKRKNNKVDGEAQEGEDADDTVVVIGRKRKYPPGTEPYLKAKPRVEAVKKALKMGSIRESFADGSPINPESLPEGFQPLATIDEAAWTIEMVAERTFLDLVCGGTYQVPLATERYRGVHARKGRPKREAPPPPPAPPTPAFQFGPIFQMGPDGPVQMPGTPVPPTEPKPKRTYKRRKVDNLLPGETAATTIADLSTSTGGIISLDQPIITSTPEQPTIIAPAIITPNDKPAKPPKKPRVTKAKKAKETDVSAGAGGSVTPSAKRKVDSKDSSPKGPPVKRTKPSGKQTAPTKQPVGEVMDIDVAPKDQPQISNPPAEPAAIGGAAIQSVTKDAVPEPTKNLVTSSTVTPAAESPLEVNIQNTPPSLHEQVDSQLPKPQEVSEPKAAIVIPPSPESQPEPMVLDNDAPTENKPTDAAKEDKILINGPTPEIIDLEADKPGPNEHEPQVEETPAPDTNEPTTVEEPPKLEPYTYDDGIRLELVPASVRKNRSIGGVLKANRRRLLMDLLASSGGAISANSGYRQFVQYIKEHTEQTSKMDRKTFNSIIEDSNRDGKIFVIGVFKSSRRIGTILTNITATFQDANVEEAKRVIVDELDKPFSWKQNVSKGIAARTANIPIERIDFETYSYATKAAALGNNRARRRLDDEKLSTLARLQAITESERKEAKGKRRTAKKDSDAMTTRTRSRTNATHEDEEDLDDPELPTDALHRWQVPRADPNIYPEELTNFPPYTVPESGSVEYGSLGTYEDYAAASAMRNSIEAKYGKLEVDGYQPILPKRRQQAGGRAGRQPRVMMTNEREINPDLEPLVEEPKRRGRKPREPKALKEPRVPRDRKSKAKALRESRPSDIPRIRTTMEEDETLALAVIIIRTLFGGYVRSIKWDLVAKALPNYDRWSIQGHWPRVRSKMKDEIAQYQSEFEEQYLRYFYKGKLPFFDKNRGVDFDLNWHVNWLRPLVKNIPAVSERRILPDTRENLDAMYEVSTLPLDWRRDFFNNMTTMSWKEHQLKNHSSSTIKVEETDGMVPDRRRAMDRAKHAWRSIFVTEDDRYDDAKARELIKAYPQLVSSAALTELHKVDRFIIRSKKGGRYGTATVQARVMQAWKTSFATQMFEEARELHESLAESLNGGSEWQVVAMALTAGSMAWLLDRVVRGEITVYTKDFKASSRGLAESLVTRAINPALFHFDIFVAKNQKGGMITRPALEPAEMLDDVPQGTMKDVAFPPFIWQNMHDEVIREMWEKVVRNVLAVVIGKPGVTKETVVRTLQGVVTVRDVVNAMRWLVHRGGVVEKVEGRYWVGREYLWCGV